MLVKFVKKQKCHWEDFLDACLYAYNTARQASSCFTPFELMFSRKANLPVDFQFDKTKAADRLLESLPQRQKGMCMHASKLYFIFSLTIIIIIADASIDIEQRIQLLSAAKNNIILAQGKQKKAYDKNHSCPEVFQVGAFVMKKDFTRKKNVKGEN